MPLPSGTWSIATIKVALRDRKFTCCRPHIFNSLTFWCCPILAMCYQLVKDVLKIHFVLAKRWDRGGGMGGEGVQYRMAALTGCRTALVSTGWIISQHVSTNGHKNHSSPLVGHHF